MGSLGTRRRGRSGRQAGQRPRPVPAPEAGSLDHRASATRRASSVPQRRARSSSPSTSGPSVCYTKKLSGGRASRYPLRLSRRAMRRAAEPVSHRGLASRVSNAAASFPAACCDAASLVRQRDAWATIVPASSRTNGGSRRHGYSSSVNSSESSAQAALSSPRCFTSSFGPTGVSQVSARPAH
jgi:hypothetical protein